MSTVHDLRETLDRHAGTLPGDGARDRAVAVRERVRVVRRRRRAGGGLAAAAALAAVAGGVSLLPVADRPSPRPADPAPTVVSPRPSGVGDRFPLQLPDGAVSTTVVVGKRGDATMSFSVGAGTRTLRWSLYCAPEDAGWVVVRFNGEQRMSGTCDRFNAEPGSAWSSFDDLRARDGSLVGPGDRVRVTMRVHERRGSKDLASRPGLRLAAGVYEERGTD